MFVAILGFIHSSDVMHVSLSFSCIFAVLLIAAKPFDARISNHLVAIPFMHCGTICYSLYLVHFPIVSIISFQLTRIGISGNQHTALLTVPLCMAASILAGIAFFHLVERHFVNPKHRDQ